MHLVRVRDRQGTGAFRNSAAAPELRLSRAGLSRAPKKSKQFSRVFLDSSALLENSVPWCTKLQAGPGWGMLLPGSAGAAAPQGLSQPVPADSQLIGL